MSEDSAHFQRDRSILGMAKSAAESRIPVSRVSRPSFLPKPKIIPPSKHAGSGIGGSTHRKSSGIISSGGINFNDNSEKSYSEIFKSRFSGNILCASSPAEERKQFNKNVSSSPWSNNEKLYDSEISRSDEKFFNSIHGSFSMLDDINDSCLMGTTLGSTFNDNGSCTLNASQKFLALNKQNSFEHDESLGILTPDQMTDFTVALGSSRTPSCENLTGSKLIAGTITSSSRVSTRPTDVPFVNDHSDLCERSPSLEELPLDPKPPKLLLEPIILPINQQQQQQQQHQGLLNNTSGIITTPPVLNAQTSASLPMSFITSVTSITSLEAGYQGDGENSRPASRGPDPPSVPVGPPPCQACRLQDPMTDSDFFTESDADAHEDIGRGDRRAQVIDGTLFCAPAGRRCPSFAGEEMDSSGIYSDLDKKQDERYNLEEQLSEDQTPDTADTADTADTIEVADGSQLLQIGQQPLLLHQAKNEISQDILDFCPKKTQKSIDSSLNLQGKSVVVVDSKSGVIHVRGTDDDRVVNKMMNKKNEPSPLKKYKMPKKHVASKIKAMIESSAKIDTTKEPRRITRTPRKTGRWAEISNKIEAGKSEQRSRPPKEIKSRFMQNLGPTVSSGSSSTSSTSAATVAPARRSPGDANISSANANKDNKRRSRGRQSISSPIQETARSSVRSSMSDLSIAPSKSTVPKRSPQAASQQRRVANGRTTLKSRATVNDAKKSCTLDFSPLNLDKSPTPIRKPTSARRSPAPNNVQKISSVTSTSPGKDRARRGSNSSTTVSPRCSNETREQAAQTNDTFGADTIKQTGSTVQALCLTIQYLSRQFDEYSVKAKSELNDLNASRAKLEENLNTERTNHTKALEELQLHLEESHIKHINELEKDMCNERNEFEKRLKESIMKLKDEHENLIERLNSEHELELKKKEEEWICRNDTMESLDSEEEIENILKKYEDLKLCIKPILLKKTEIIEKLKSEIAELKKQGKEKRALRKKVEELETQIQESTDSKRLLDFDTGDVADIGMNSNEQSSTLRAEVWSLRSVLELRSQENATMRSEIEILRRDVEGKEILEQRIEALEARCEDLKAQLQSKESYMRTISHQNEVLLGSFHDVSKHNKRLSQRNEELQWRLRQKNEVVSVLANQLATPPQRLSRSLGPEHIEHSLNQEKNSQPTSSSMIKFMVQKGDSVSWTLEIDDPVDSVSNGGENTRTVSRHNSFRKTPRKSIDLRARSKSVSTSDNLRDDPWSPTYNSTPMAVRNRPLSDPSANTTSVNDSNTDPNSGPRPQEAGGEAMISEETSATSSEDESSASSDISRLAMEFAWSNSVE